MKIEKSERGFRFLMHEAYLDPHEPLRLASESSAVGDYKDSFDNPGSSYLWIGEHHHLNREEVGKLVDYLNGWLKTKRLRAAPAPETGGE